MIIYSFVLQIKDISIYHQWLVGHFGEHEGTGSTGIMQVLIRYRNLFRLTIKKQQSYTCLLLLYSWLISHLLMLLTLFFLRQQINNVFGVNIELKHCSFLLWSGGLPTLTLSLISFLLHWQCFPPLFCWRTMRHDPKIFNVCLPLYK